jgi:two-component system cell cycle sensor histidine kinase/response regulator CckA
LKRYAGNISAGRGKEILNCKDTEIKYKALFQQSPYGILVVDTEGRILDFNESAHRDLGYTKEEFANLTLSDIDPIENPAEIKSRISRILTDGRAEFEVRHRTKQGQMRDVQVIIQALVLSGQTVLHAIWRDITEYKRAAEMLRKTNTRLETLIQAIPDMVFFRDAAGRYVTVNRAVEEYCGLRQEDFVGKTNFELFPREAAAMCDRSDQEAIRKEEPIHAEEQSSDAAGRPLFLDTIKAPVYDGKGSFAGLLCVARDITERKKAEEALRQSEEKFRTLFESTTDGLFIIAMDGNLIDINRTAYERLGYTKDEMLSIHMSQLNHPDFRDKIPQRMEQVRTQGWCVCESAHLRKDGTVMPVEINVRIIDFEGRKVFFAVIRDITDRRQSEEALRRNEEFIRNILDNVDEGFLVIDRDFNIVAANSAYCAWGNVPREGIVGRKCYEVSHRTTRPCHEEGEDCSVKRAFETGMPYAAIHKHEDEKGGILYVETKAFPLRDSSGGVTSAIETIHNITERHLLEAEQLKTQKLEAIGTLAGGIAHDFNNLLQGMFGYIAMAKVNLDKKEKARAMLDQAENALNMSVSLTNQLLTFSKGGRPVMKRITLGSVIENAANFALSGSRSHSRITLDDCLRHVEADEGQMGQVIQNIVLNANEAMPDGGNIEISARNVDIPQGSNPLLPIGGKFVKISIKDIGVGIPAQHLPRIFDPYFTTKQKGSGLGLATSYSIIRNHGGMIEVASELNEGSAFSIYLPASEPEDEKKPQVRAVTPARRGKILVMDDEDIIRNVAQTMIESLGHAADCAATGEEAIAKFAEAMNAGKPFDVVILDLTVRGGMGGEQAVSGIRKMDPAAKTIVSSGYADNPVVSDYRSYGFDAFLNKPYMIDALGESLNTLLK